MACRSYVQDPADILYSFDDAYNPSMVPVKVPLGQHRVSGISLIWPSDFQTFRPSDLQNFRLSLQTTIYRDNAAVFVVFQLNHFDAPQPCLAS